MKWNRVILIVSVFLSVTAFAGSLEENEERMRYLQEMESKNSVGDIAVDFAFLKKDGMTDSLHNISSDYVLLYFNDPDCSDCKMLKDSLFVSAILNELIDNDKMKVLSVCVEGKTVEWNAQRLPEGWIDACDENMTITDDELYYLPCLPVLYLLDGKHRVLLKNTNVQELEGFLGN